MTNIDLEIEKAREWKAKNDKLLAELHWKNRRKDAIKFHELILENLERMKIVADAGKIDEITQLGGFRIYLIGKENIPSYCEDFEGEYQASKRYWNFRRYRDSIIPTYFKALRSRENLEPKIPRENAKRAIKRLDELVLIPFDEEYQIAEIVNNIDDVRESILGIERYKYYPKK